MAGPVDKTNVEVNLQTNKLKAGFESLKGQVGGMMGGLLSKAAPLTAMFAGAFGLYKSIEAFAAAEKAENDLKTALETTGQAAESNLESFKKFATAVQKITTVDDEAILGLATYATNLGLTGDASRETIKAAIGLQKAFGVDAKDAIKGLSMEMQGIPSKLTKAIPALKGVTDQTERLKILSAAASAGFKQEMGSIGTLSGSWEQLKQQLENVGEQVGSLIAGEGGNLLGWLTDLVISFQEGMAVLLQWKTEFKGAMEEGAASGQGFMGGMAAVFNYITGAFQSMFKAATFTASNFGLVWDSIVESFFNMVTTIVERAKWMGENIVIVGKFFYDNWREIFTDIYEGAKTIFSNLVENIKNIFSSLWEFIKSGFTAGLDINWTPMLDGFKSAVKNDLKLAEYIGPELDKSAAGKLQAGYEEFEKNAEKAGMAAKKAFEDAVGGSGTKGDIDLEKTKDAKNKDKKKGEGKFTAVEDVFKQIAESANKKKDEKVQQDQLTAQQEIAKNTGKMVNGVPAVAG